MYIKEINIPLFACPMPQRPEKYMMILITMNRMRLIHDNSWCLLKIGKVESNQSMTLAKTVTMPNCKINCRTVIVMLSV